MVNAAHQWGAQFGWTGVDLFFVLSGFLITGILMADQSHIGMAWVTYLGPTWSLSIEEQFYLVWPPVVRWLNNRQLCTLALLVLVAGISLRCFLLIGFDVRYTSQIFLFTLTHLDGLCVGIPLRLAFNSPRARPALIAFARFWWLWTAPSWRCLSSMGRSAGQMFPAHINH